MPRYLTSTSLAVQDLFQGDRSTTSTGSFWWIGCLASIERRHGPTMDFSTCEPMSDSQPVHQHVYESICVCVRMPIPGFWIHDDPMKPIPWFAYEPKKPSVSSVSSPQKNLVLFPTLPPKTPSRLTIPCQFLQHFFWAGLTQQKQQPPTGWTSANHRGEIPKHLKVWQR